jgi:N-acetyl sugar amidotransferase
MPSVTFNDRGICSQCRTHDALDREYPTGEEGERRLRAIADAIRRAGRGKPYDVIVGVSGGCDSSYMLYYAKRVLGLRPLAVHFDNTWNTRTAVENIQRVLRALDVDLFTYVVNNEEYDSLYRAFLLAGVPDFDSQTDIGLAAVLNLAANKYGVSYVFEGHSFRTEGIAPLGWVYMDGRYIESVNERFGSMPLKTFPNMKFWTFVRSMSRIKKIRPLYWLDYDKRASMDLLSAECGWRWYGGHHLENQGAAFAHTYYFPKRYGRDTRVLGYAALVRSGQMSREEGLRLLAEPRTFDPALVEMVKKRLRFEGDALDRLIDDTPRRTYRDFDTYKTTFERLRLLFWLMYKAHRVPKSFYMKYTSPDPLPRRQAQGPDRVIPLIASPTTVAAALAPRDRPPSRVM